MDAELRDMTTSRRDPPAVRPRGVAREPRALNSAPAIWRRFIAWVDEVSGRARRRRLEEELARTDAEILRLRHLLAEATRPPAQFARMREREVALRRLTRLRIAGEGRHERDRSLRAG
jgi:hypothetical protein